MRNALSRITTLVATTAALGLAVTGTAFAGDGVASWYNDAGYGACGTLIDASTEWLVAAPVSLWTTPNPNLDPLCGHSIEVTHNGTTFTVPIRDKCPSCDPSKIDLSLPAFRSVADPDVGIIAVSWRIV